MTCCNKSNTLSLGYYPSCSIIEITKVSGYVGDYSVIINWNDTYLPIQVGITVNNTSPFIVDLTKLNEKGCFTAKIMDSDGNIIIQPFNIDDDIVDVTCYEFKTIVQL